MKIRKDGKFPFYGSLIVSIGIVILETVKIFNNNIEIMDIIMDILMLIVLISTMFSCLEKK